MKRLIPLLFCSLFFSNFNSAQIVLDVTEEVYDFDNVDLSQQFVELKIENFLTNETTDSLDIRWTFIQGTCPEEWFFTKADENLSWAPVATTNVAVPGPPNLPIILEPGEMDSPLFLYLYPSPTAGCCQVVFEFSDASDSTATPFASATYDIYVNAPDCPLVSSTFEERNKSVNIFPNPTTGFISVQSEFAVKKVQVYSAHSQEFGTVDVSKNNELDLSHLPAGLYFLKIEMENGRLAWSKVYKE